ncbi:hypothetical protein [Streptomyces sp. NPDC000410]|uniref:hypothetical protein n=1 Tax=Streptomyces sp. NPDC000410 TaxID=3154254 RepID=UPI00332D4BEF
MPTHETAYEYAPTAKAYLRLIRRRVLWLTAMISTPVALVPTFDYFLDDRDAIPLASMAVISSLVTVPFAGMGVWGAPRIGRILRCYPWRAYPCTYVPLSRDFVMVLAIVPDREVAIHGAPYSCDFQRKQNPHPEIIWFAGDPACGGVASPAGGHYPQRVVVTRPHAGEPPSPPDEVAIRAGLAKNGRYLARWL